MPPISVIVVTYNSAATIGACLRPLVSAPAAGGSAEIIVIDNCSTDGTAGIVRADFPQVRCITSEFNKGFAAAVNSGASLASGEYLFILNPDTQVDGTFIGRMIAELSADRSIVLAGCRWVGPDGAPQPSAWRLPDLLTIAAESFLPYTLSTRILRCDRGGVLTSGFVSGGCFLVRSELFRSLRGFDERYFMYYEDADFCLRARAAGYPPRFFGDLHVVHHGRASFGGNLAGFFVRYYGSKLVYCERNFGAGRAAIARALILSGIALRIPAYRLAGIVTGRKEFMELAEAHGEVWKGFKSKSKK